MTHRGKDEELEAACNKLADVVPFGHLLAATNIASLLVEAAEEIMTLRKLADSSGQQRRSSMTREELEELKAHYKDAERHRQTSLRYIDIWALIDALEEVWKELDGWKECAHKYQAERSMWIDEVHALRDRIAGKDAEIVALTADRDAYKFIAEQAIGMGTTKALMDERDQLKHRVRELEVLVKTLSPAVAEFGGCE